MHTGVSLDDDLSRFQIIVKLPFLSLGDRRVKRKSEIDPDWYLNKMWLTVIQAAGRSTRNEKDESVTYILDKSTPYFLNKWRSNLPKDFLSRLDE
jgi:Rad3-related DNA helicase